jgi:hypothetical protein
MTEILVPKEAGACLFGGFSRIGFDHFQELARRKSDLFDVLGNANRDYGRKE